ncbi:MAG: sigma-70 family RNA polymerase sigma factor [Pseudomonadota bacterium]
MGEVSGDIARLYRQDYSRLLGALIRQLGDFALAEDVLQDAFAAAITAWAEKGLPTRPDAWIMKAAKNRALDHLRRVSRFDNRAERIAQFERELRATDEEVENDYFHDDLLRLIFTCCHPSLAPEAQVALTLKTIGGLTTEEVAHAFLVPVPTMAQRLVRAKRKISGAGIPYRVPEPSVLPQRMREVLAVLYLIFNEGFTPSEGTRPVREELCRDAIRIARVLITVMEEGAHGASIDEARGLLALMLLNVARTEARIGTDGERVLLEEQDRTLWCAQDIDEGRRLVRDALGRGALGPYLVQAAIAAVHSEALEATATDWRQIAGLYEVLNRLQPNPIVELNRAVAISMVDGPRAGLRIIDSLLGAKVLAGYHWLPAARADMLRQLGRTTEAVAAYREALSLARSEVDRRFLTKRIVSLE